MVMKYTRVWIVKFLFFCNRNFKISVEILQHSALPGRWAMIVSPNSAQYFVYFNTICFIITSLTSLLYILISSQHITRISRQSPTIDCCKVHQNLKPLEIFSLDLHNFSSFLPLVFHWQATIMGPVSIFFDQIISECFYEV